MLGEGRSGKVYSAEHTSTKVVVAVKYIREGFFRDELTVDRLKDDLVKLQRISHPNVAEVLDWHLSYPPGGGDSYIVTELLVGQPLAGLLRESMKLEIEDAVAIMLQVLEALSAAHQAGVAHRNLDPCNVFLIKNPGSGSPVKVLDFGLAPPPSEKDGPGDAPPERAGYMPPEHFRGGELDLRSDVFACGMMMMRMLTGTLPQAQHEGGRARPEFVADYVEPEEYPPAASLNPVIPDALDFIISKAVRMEPGDRYPQASQIQEDLVKFVEQFQAGKAVPAGAGFASSDLSGKIAVLDKKLSRNLAAVPDGGPAVFERKKRRGRAVAFTVLAVLVVALLGAGGYLVFFMDLASSGTPREEGPGGGAAASSNGSAAAAPDASALAAAADVKAEGNEEAPAGSLHETVHVVVSGAPEGAVARLGDMLLEGNPPEGEIAAGNEPVELVVTAEGYEEYSGEVVPEKHLVVKVAMTSLYPRGKGKALVASTAGPGGEDDEAKKLKKKRRKKRKKKTSGWLFVD